jgi:hypothetical protein
MLDVALIDAGCLIAIGLAWRYAGRLRPFCALAAGWVVIEIVGHGFMETAVAHFFIRVLP